MQLIKFESARSKGQERTLSSQGVLGLTNFSSLSFRINALYKAFKITVGESTKLSFRA